MSPQTQQMIMGLLMWVVVFGVFYFLLIRPQKKKDKELKEMRENLNVGDKVTTISGNSIAMASSAITTASSAFGGFYASKNIKEKGLIYGLLVGLMYIVCLTLIVFLAKDSFVFEMDILYKVLLVSLAGGIGGVLGVNFK